MVMLDTFADDPDVIVAHFNHGTRPSADDDQKFVASQAAHYQKPFFTSKQILGSKTTEEVARSARYCFLEQIAREQQAEIYTAHHQDDLLESIAINILRGTGWRGLVPLDRPRIHRPLLSKSKEDIFKYAAKHQICFRQDPTNAEDNYLRNRLRPLIAALPNRTRKQLLELYRSQKNHKQEIELLLQEFLPPSRHYERSWFLPPQVLASSENATSSTGKTTMPTSRSASAEFDQVFIEYLRSALIRTGLSATRPQLQDFLQAIRTYAPGKRFNLPGDHLVTIHKTYFKL